MALDEGRSESQHSVRRRKQGASSSLDRGLIGEAERAERDAAADDEPDGCWRG